MSIVKERGFFEASVDKLARQSFAGMAHFAGTGPDSQCNKCDHWDQANQRLGRAQCKKYEALTNKLGANVPGEALACKYFVERA